MNKEALMGFLKNKLGENFDESVFTDEEMKSLFPDEDLEDIDDEDVDDNTSDDNDIEDEDTDDEDIDFNDLDESQMTASEKMLYRALKREKEKALRDKMNVMISNADISPSQKKMLSKMVSLGIDTKELSNQIAELVEEANKTKRQKGLDTKMFSKKQIKINGDKKADKIKIGSRDFGASLVPVKKK